MINLIKNLIVVVSGMKHEFQKHQLSTLAKVLLAELEYRLTTKDDVVSTTN